LCPALLHSCLKLFQLPFFLWFTASLSRYFASKMVGRTLIAAIAAWSQLANAGCPYMEGGSPGTQESHPKARRDAAGAISTNDFLAKYEINDSDVYLTNNFGGPIEDQESLSAGERGPTLLEDFIFREKITHFGMVQRSFSNTTF
jgi:hypothetical protein